MALAILILPTVLSNVWQSLRGGIAGAKAALRKHWRYVGITMVFILLSAQLVTILPARAIFLVLGVPVLLLSLVQLVGWSPHIDGARKHLFEIVAAVVSGAIGGVSGVWGPTTILYLTALNTPKSEQMQVTGVVFGLGSVMLTLGHLRSGVLNADTAPLSLAMVVPVMAGMALGLAVHDRLDQKRFRQATLVLLIVAGLNLIRRGLIG